MTNSTRATHSKVRSIIRWIMVILGFITSPLLCMGGLLLADAVLPMPFGLFKTEISVENKSGETLYLTPITTTRGEPEVILQMLALRLRDVPLQPNGMLVFTYDAADSPLTGMAVCRAGGECRLLEGYPNPQTIASFESLPALEADWKTAIETYPEYNFVALVLLLLCLLPVGLLWGSTYVDRPRSP